MIQLSVLLLTMAACSKEPAAPPAAPAAPAAPSAPAAPGEAAPPAPPPGAEVVDGAAPSAEATPPTATTADATTPSTPTAAGSATPAQPVGAAPTTATPAAPATPATPSPAATASTPAAATPATPEAPATPPPPVVRTYTLDAKQSQLYVQVFKDPDTMAAGMSHDHVISAAGWSGEVTWDAANPASCKVRIELPVSKLVVDSPEMRKKVGYDASLSDSQRDDVKTNMLASSQLNSGSFPSITFTSSKCEASGEKVKVSGSLSIRGKSANVSTTMKLSADASAFSASGTFTAKASDFGFQPYTAMMGALKNKNEMKFTVSVKGAAQ